MIGEFFTSLLSNSIGGSLIAFLVALVPLIIIHELGHFIAARLSGVWVREFGIGYPPRMLKLFRWKETEFTLNWLPLGGFARMEGEGFMGESPTDPANTDQSPKASDKKRAEALQHSLYTASPGKRLKIYVSGPLMNLLTAWMLCILLFTTGVPAAQVVISAIAPNSPAEEAGLKEGDVIVTIDDHVMEGIPDVTDYIQKHKGEQIELTIERNGSQEDNTQTQQVHLVPRVNPPEGEGAMGVGIYGQLVPERQTRYSLSRSLKFGTEYMFTIVGATIFIPVNLIQGIVSIKDARPVGIIGISQIAQRSVENSLYVGSLYPLFNIMIVISVSLGIFNLLPIPALDGGRILLTLIEMIRGAPLTPAIQERIHQVALLLLLALFFVITAMDILYPVELPPPLQ